MPTSEKLIQDLLAGTFELDCPQMTLRRGDGKKTFQGSGFIRVTDGRLVFTLISRSRGGLAEGFAVTFPQAGEGGLIPKDQLYELSAVDHVGDRWSATGIRPGCSTGKRLVIRGNLRVLDRNKPRRPRVKDRWIAVDIFEPLEFPANVVTSTTVERAGRTALSSSERNAAEFSACGCHFSVVKTDHGTRLSIEGDRLPKDVAERSLEALTFLLARPVQWNVITDNTLGSGHVRIKSRMPPPPRNLYRPPLMFAVTDSTGGFWRMFEAYLTKLIRDDRDDWHELTKWVVSVMEPGPSVYGFALALPVAIEGVLHSEFEGYGKPPPADQVNALISHVELLAGHPLLDRAVGSLRGLQSSRAGDKLKQLAEEGVIPDSHIKLWQQLRNRAAHGAPHDGRAVGKLMALCRTVNMVFNRIVLKSLGFTGKITDFDSPGHPLTDFPQSPATA